MKPTSEMTVEELRAEFKSYGEKFAINEASKKIFQKQLERYRRSKKIVVNPDSSPAVASSSRAGNRTRRGSSRFPAKAAEEATPPPTQVGLRTPFAVRSSRKGRRSSIKAPVVTSSPASDSDSSASLERSEAPATSQPRRVSTRGKTPALQADPSPVITKKELASPPPERSDSPIFIGTQAGQKRQFDWNNDESSMMTKSEPSPVQEAPLSAAQIALANAVKGSRALFDSNHPDYCKRDVTSSQWLKIATVVGHKGQLGVLMKAWNDLVNRYEQAKDSEHPSQIRELLRFIDELPPAEAELIPVSGRKRAAAVMEPSDQRTPKRAKQDEVLNGSVIATPLEAIEEFEAFGRFVATALRRMAQENQNPAMDEMYAIIRKYR
uniref:MADF domain-containing protein n=1 Tax=Steinernema glaseri TaxID=37863 RepID=A0A1I7ZY31_9BILA